MIIALTGYARSGKDEVGRILVERAGFVRLGMGDILRDACIALNPIVHVDPDGYKVRYDELLRYEGYEDSKIGYPEFRSFMERLGTEFAEAIGYPKLWIDTLLHKADDIDTDIVMTSCRRRVEAEAVVENGGKVWRVTRPGVGPVSSHSAEYEMGGWDFDEYIENDGTLEELVFKVLDILDGDEVERLVTHLARRQERLATLTQRELERVDL